MIRVVPLLLAIALPLTGAAAAERDRGPGIAGQRQGAMIVYPVRDFDAVTLGGAATVDVRVGSAWSVRAEGPAEAFANLRIVRNGRSLEIGRRYEGGRYAELDKRITVHVTMPALTALTLGGSGRLSADQAGGGDFAANVGGSGSLEIGRLKARVAEFNLGGSGSIAVAGQVGQLEVSLGGSGRVVAPALRSNSAVISMGGSGSVRTTVAGTAQVSMAGSGSVDLGPNARCTVSKIGSGTVRCGR